MNKKDKLWTVSHDIIEMFEKDFGLFKNMALKIAYDYIMNMPDKDVDALIRKLKSILELPDDPNAKKK